MNETSSESAETVRSAERRTDESGERETSEESSSDDSSVPSHTLTEKGAWIGGGITGFIALGASLAIGQVSPYEGHHLLEGALPSTRFLCSAVITASATILALLLTLLAISFNTEGDLRAEHYLRIKHIAFYDTLCLIAASLFLLIHAIPIASPEDVQVPRGWYDIIYYVALALAAALSGFLVSVVLMLYGIVSDLIEVYGFKQTNHEVFHSSGDR